jgi:hypothetical protein
LLCAFDDELAAPVCVSGSANMFAGTRVEDPPLRNVQDVWQLCFSLGLFMS